MASHTTVAIDQDVRRKLKKLASLLDVSQGEVIKQALAILEEKIITGKREPRESNPLARIDKKEIGRILQDATRKVWGANPEIKRIQEKLFSGPETIDDFIINDWDSGLE
jgi:predicted transcriptional regulator